MEYLGADTFLIVDCGPNGQMTVRAPGESEHRVGDEIGLRFEAADTHFFRADGQVAG